MSALRLPRVLAVSALLGGAVATAAPVSADDAPTTADPAAADAIDPADPAATAATDTVEALVEVVASPSAHPVGPIVGHTSRGNPVVEVSGPRGDVEALRSSPGVAAVQVSEPLTVALDRTVPSVGAPTMWAASGRGAGRTIAVVDSGVDRDHPALAGAVVHEACFVDGTCPDGRPSMVGPGAAVPCGDGTSFTCRHGTQVAGVIAGRGAGVVGVAPEASIAAVQIFEGDSTDVTSLWRALDHLAGVADQIGLSVVNLSIAGGRALPVPCDTEAPLVADAVAELAALGVATVVASGNAGWVDSLPMPACLSNTVDVAALDDDRVLWPGSSLAPGVVVAAPGVGVDSSVPGGGSAPFTGTSAAAPHVSAGLALIDQRFPAASLPQHLQLLGGGPRIATPIGPLPRLDLARVAALYDLVPDPPFGTVDRAEPLPGGRARVAGWAIDPDTREPVPIHVYLDGVLTVAAPADRPRPDVGAVFGLGSSRGFDLELAVGAGDHILCIAALDVGFLAPNAFLGCHPIQATDRAPLGALDRLDVAPADPTAPLGSRSVTVAGWAADPDHPDATVTVHVYVDGTLAGAGPASTPRPDVDAALGLGGQHGYAVAVPVIRPGAEVCVWALGVEAPNSRRLGCRSA